MLRRLAANAAANVVNGASQLAFQLAATGLVTRHTSSSQFALWSLVMSIASIAPLFACNLSNAVARRLAVGERAANELERVRHQESVMAAGRRMAALLLGVGLAFGLAAGGASPWVYTALLGTAPWDGAIQIAAFFIGSCWIVGSQPEIGWLLYKQRNWAIALAAVTARLLAVCALWLLLAGNHATAGVVAAAATLWIGKWSVSRMGPSKPPEQGDNTSEWLQLKRVTRGLAVWGFASMAIQGATIPLIALMSGAETSAYFLAYSLVIAITGLATATVNTLVSPIASILANAQLERARYVVTRATIVLTGAVLVALIAVWASMRPILQVWTGQSSQSGAVSTAFALFGVQQLIRTIGLPMAIALAMGIRPELLQRVPLLEGTVGVVIAIPMGFWLGPAWFLIGLSVAAAAGVAGIFWLAHRHLLVEQVAP